MRYPTHFVTLTGDHRADWMVWQEFLESITGQALCKFGTVFNLELFPDYVSRRGMARFAIVCGARRLGQVCSGGGGS